MVIDYNVFSFAGFSDPHIAGSSGAGVSPVTVPVASVDRCTQADLKDPKNSSRFFRRKRRRAVRAGSGGRLLEKALASFINWQQAMEERYVSLEEMRLHQEARSERQREHQEERRHQQEREHELRLVSLLAKAFSETRGTSEQGSHATETSDPSATVSEQTLHSVPPPFPPDPPTFLTVPRVVQEERTFDQGRSNTMILDSSAIVSVLPQSPFEPRMLKGNRRADEANPSSTTSDNSTKASELAPFSVPLSSSGPGSGSGPGRGPFTLPFVPSMLRGDQTPQHSNFLSLRGNRIRQHQGTLQEGYKQYFANKHDEDSNPDVSGTPVTPPSALSTFLAHFIVDEGLFSEMIL